MAVSLDHSSASSFAACQGLDSMEIESFEKIEGLVDSLKELNEGINWQEESEIIERKYIRKARALIFDVALVDQEIAGYVVVEKKTKEDGSILAHMSYLAVSKKHQSKGIGSILFRSAAKKLKRLSIKTLKLECKDRLVPFYKKVASQEKLKFSLKADEPVPDVEGDYWSKIKISFNSKD
jgi:predicted N-acetyltransferase YhbS